MKRRGLLLFGLAAAATATLPWVPPIRQDPDYHNFADRRTFFDIPNFFDVVSNLPFAVVGTLGLTLVLRGRCWDRVGFGALFTGIALTAAGSAYYHFAPSDGRLFWDRLPISIVAASLLAIAIADRIEPTLGRRLLPLLVMAGAASVQYSRSGDLRFYGLVQFFPLLAIPLMVFLYPPRYTGNTAWLAVVGLYAAAKVLEQLDAQIFALGGVISGHTLKHLIAGLAAYGTLGLARVRPAS